MKITVKEYFSRYEGTGVLATADSDGKTDAAIYSRPHVFDDGTIAFVMRQRLTHANLQSNPHATFLFMKHAAHYSGVRLFLKKTREETDAVLIEEMTRRGLTPEEDRAKGPKFLVHFRIERILPLIGSGETEISLS